MNRTLLNRIALVLAFAGIFDAGFLGMSHLLGLSIPCGVGDGCDKVAASPYSYWLGIPVSFLGLGAYLTLTALALIRIFRPNRSQVATTLGLAVSAVGTAISFFLIYESVFVIQATCTWCVASATIMTLTLLTHGLLYQVDKEGEANPRVDKVLVGVLSVLLVGGLAARGANLKKAVQVDTIVAGSIESYVPKDAHIMGPAEAPLTIIEFGDLTCPHCRDSYLEFKKAQEKSNGRFRFVFRHFPLFSLPGHELSLPAAVLSEMASEKGQFWPYVDQVFAVEEPAKMTAEELMRIATSSGVDIAKAKIRINDDKDPAYARVQKDMDAGGALGIHATPTFLVGLKGQKAKAESMNSMKEALKNGPYNQYVNTSAG